MLLHFSIICITNVHFRENMEWMASISPLFVGLCISQNSLS